MSTDIIFQQLLDSETSTYTYLIADKVTRQAAIIDPVLEMNQRDLLLIEQLELKLVYVLDTHIHADHVTGAKLLRNKTNAKTAISQFAGVTGADLQLFDGQELYLGDQKIKVIATPGHTNTCMTYLFKNMAFTGDALLIRSCGRTDFQQGSADQLFESVRGKIFNLADDTIVFPGHDYKGFTSSTIELEKKFNARLALSKSKEDFKKIMSELNLAYPKKIDIAVPANLAGGQIQELQSKK